MRVSSSLFLQTPSVVHPEPLARHFPDALFEEVFAFGSRWYALREVPLEAYRDAMVPRSGKWRTVHVPAERFRVISRPFSVRSPAGGVSACERPEAAIS